MARVNLKTRQIDFGVVARDLFDIIKSDDGVNEIVFEIPEELQDFTWSVIYESANGERYVYTDSVKDGKFVWVIHNSVTKESGRVSYTLEAVKDTQRWHTVQQSFYVKKSLSNNGTVDDKTYGDVLELVEQAEQAKTAAETAAEGAEAAQTAAENVRVLFTATATRNASGVTVEVTDQNGTTSAQLNDGERGPQGIQGPQGEQGEPGHTPIKGVDYMTTADIVGIEDDIKEWCLGHILGGTS